MAYVKGEDNIAKTQQFSKDIGSLLSKSIK